jgi:hypothetical protein
MLTHKRLVLALALSIAALALTIPAAAAAGNGATKQQLLANTFGICSQGATSGRPLGNSFVILNKADGNVSAEIHLQGAPAGGEWRIELAQRPLEGCNPAVEGIITTNSQGNGNAHLSEPILPGNTGAFVRLVPLNAAAAATGIIANTGVTLP